MGLKLIPKDLHSRYCFEERGHACVILAADFTAELKDMVACLRAFSLKKSEVIKGGGRKTDIANSIDVFLNARGWSEKSFDIQTLVDGSARPTPTHKIDNFKNRVGIEVEWNNKDPFFDRDLNNFRLLHQLGVLSVGVIITRMSELQGIFDQLGKGKSYGQSTTHWRKLIPRVNGGGAGGCPLLMVGISTSCYDPNA